MLKFVFPLIVGIALSVPAIAQDPYQRPMRCLQGQPQYAEMARIALANIPMQAEPAPTTAASRAICLDKSGTGMGVLRANLGTPVSVAELRE
jgi:hypothetical protein